MRKQLDWFKQSHRWFAWYPIRIGNVRIWWEYVERKWVERRLEQGTGNVKTIVVEAHWEYAAIDEYVGRP